MKKKEFLKLKEGITKVTFKGNKYLLIGVLQSRSFAIATQEQYENFLPSYAHLFEDGNILMYGEKIGTYKDLRLIEE